MSREISFPFRFGTDGKAVTTTDLDLQLQQDMLALIGTIPGERVLLPDYGANLLPYVFSNISRPEAAHIQETVAAAITKYVPNAALDTLTVGDSDSSGYAPVTISYHRTVPVPGTQSSGTATVVIGGTS